MTSLLASLEPETRTKILRAEARRRGLIGGVTEPGFVLPSAALPWREWLQRYYPYVASAPLAERHVRLWEWFEALERGTRPSPRVEVWPRGGAKSSTGELGCARVGAKLSRRFALYVSETQEQADKHVQSVATLFETLGVERAVGKYGPKSGGWRRDQLRTANGFNVAAIGLDVAARGVKLDQYRPDLIIFDDIDNQTDSANTIKRKVQAITKALIPAGSADCAVLFLQNKIHEDGIVSQLADGRADFLHDREVPTVEPAVIGLEVETVEREDGPNVYRIVSGIPTWAGQDMQVCEQQINAWGLTAFREEAQHEVEGAGGYIFATGELKVCSPEDVPELAAVAVAPDLAATEGGGDWTVYAVLGKGVNGKYYVLAIIAGQWSPERVKAATRMVLEHYKKRFPRLKVRFPQDGGQAGKAQAVDLGREFANYAPTILSVTGPKATRAANFAEAVNRGDVYLVRESLPEFLFTTRSPETGNRPLFKERHDLQFSVWHHRFKEVLRKFRDDEPNQQDDDVDAAADAFNELNGISEPSKTPAANPITLASGTTYAPGRKASGTHPLWQR